MSETKQIRPEDTHWRKLMNTKYLSGEELPDKDIAVVIEKYTQEEVYNQNTGKIESEVILHFKGASKPYLCTKRQAKNIAATLGTGLVAEWVGKTITIFPKKEKYFGKWMNVLNVK